VFEDLDARGVLLGDSLDYLESEVLRVDPIKEGPQLYQARVKAALMQEFFT
jgi:hypothetical protein